MRTFIRFVMVVVILMIMMSVLATSQTLTAPQAVTDPKLITSKPDARVEKSLSIEKLYMTRQVGGSTGRRMAGLRMARLRMERQSPSSAT